MQHRQEFEQKLVQQKIRKKRARGGGKEVAAYLLRVLN